MCPKNENNHHFGLKITLGTRYGGLFLPWTSAKSRKVHGNPLINLYLRTQRLKGYLFFLTSLQARRDTELYQLTAACQHPPIYRFVHFWYILEA